MRINENWIGWINPLLICLTLFLVYLGYRKGFLSKLFSLFSFIGIVLISWKIAPWLSDTFKIIPMEWAPYQGSILQDFFYGYMNQLALFVLLVIGASVILFIFKPILLLIGKLPVISWVNALFGSLLGLVESFLLMCVLVFILQTPLIVNADAVLENSVLNKVVEWQEKLFVVGADFLEDFRALKPDENGNVEELKLFLEKQGIEESTIQQFLLELSQ